MPVVADPGPAPDLGPAPEVKPRLPPAAIAAAPAQVQQGPTRVLPVRQFGDGVPRPDRGGATRRPGDAGPAVPAALRRSSADAPQRHDAVAGELRAVPDVLRRSVIRRGPDDPPGGDPVTTTKTVPQTAARKIGYRRGGPGTRNEIKVGAVAGTLAKGEDKSQTYDGRTTHTTADAGESLTGAQAWIKIINEASDAQILDALDVGARAGAFGKRAYAESFEVGPGGVGVGGSYEAMAGAASGLSTSLKVDTAALIPAVQAAVQAYAKAGVGLDVAGSVFQRLWKLEAMATGKVSLFAGVSAAGRANATVSPVGGFKLKATGAVLAGAQGTASVTQTLRLGPAELSGMLAVRGTAGAWAEGLGKLDISFDGVQVTYKGEAYAGAELRKTGQIDAMLRGKQIFFAKGVVNVNAGIGGRLSGKFLWKGGRIQVSMGATGVLGIGAGTKVTTMLDLETLGQEITNVVYEQYHAYVNEITEDAGLIDREAIIDPVRAAAVTKQAYDTYLPHFRAYAAQEFSKDGNGIDQKRVQAILDKYRGVIGMDLVFIEADAGIAQAAQDAFGPLLKHIRTVGGKINSFGAPSGASVPGARAEHAKQVASARARAALAAAYRQDQARGIYRAEKATTDSFLKGPYNDLKAVFGDGADGQAASIIEDVYGGVFSEVKVKDGTIIQGTDHLAVANKRSQAAERLQGIQSRLAADEAITSECARYAARKAEHGTAGIKKDEVAKIIAKNGGPLLAAPTADEQAAFESVITDAVANGLGDAIEEFHYSGGAIAQWKAADAAEMKRRFTRDKDAQRRQRIYEAAKKELADYAAKKARQGKEGVKEGNVNEIVQKSFNDATRNGRDHQEEADAALQDAARVALGNMVIAISIRDGNVDEFKPDVAGLGKLIYEIESSREGQYFGADQGNERRYVVSKQFRERLNKHAAAVLADPRGMPNLTDIQGVVDAAVKGHRDELFFDDARAALEQLILKAFRGAVTSVTVGGGGQLIKASFNPEARQSRPGKGGTADQDD